ncbi:MAG: non-canonical purine NTP diphosphatase [Bacteroidales bacterium]|nr:non-canonical purine NTP diphosphatase [Bacteroidales bacterium]
MHKIVFATNNSNKLEEVSQILKDKVEILSLKDIGCFDDIPETADTLEGNALIKARYIKENFGLDCFADDSGLEIEALNSAPGVFSARYAGEQKNHNDNMQKVLSELNGINNRKAQFRTVIAVVEGDKELLFEGKIEGAIIKEKRGNGGFGYDPIFTPDGFEQTFAELGSEIKNKISHRAKAVQKLIEYLQAE